MTVKEGLGVRHHIGRAFEAAESDALRVHPERCAKVRNRNVACLKCADACTSGCIALVEGELIVDQTKCVGCGTCATVCPTCSLESLNPTDAELRQEAQRLVDQNVSALSFCCRPMAEALQAVVRPERVVPVVCLGRVDESLLLNIAVQGVEEIHLLSGRCEHCAQAHGRNTAAMVAASAQDLAKAWGKTLTVVVEDEPDPLLLQEGASLEDARSARDVAFAVLTGNTPIGVTHRAGGEMAVEAGAEAAAIAVLGGEEVGAPAGDPPAAASSSAQKLHSVMKDGTLPHFIPDRRERLLDALALWGEPQETTLKNRLWGSVVIDGTRCVSCRMCATFCPTGAITKFDDEDEMGVMHRPSDCVACKSCADICPADAIVVLDEVKTKALMEGTVHRYKMNPRPVTLHDNPHQILDTMRQSLNGDIFER